MDQCPIQGESKTLICLTLTETEISAAPPGLSLKDLALNRVTLRVKGPHKYKRQTCNTGTRQTEIEIETQTQQKQKQKHKHKECDKQKRRGTETEVGRKAEQNKYTKDQGHFITLLTCKPHTN